MIRIRHATAADVPFMADRPAREFCAFVTQERDIYCREHIERLIAGLVEKHFCALAVEDDTIIGGIAAVTHPHLWNPAITCASECFWWVDESRRQSRAGYLLLDAYKHFAMESGIGLATLCLLEGSAVREESLARLGFVRRESTYHLEKHHA